MPAKAVNTITGPKPGAGNGTGVEFRVGEPAVATGGAVGLPDGEGDGGADGSTGVA